MFECHVTDNYVTLLDSCVKCLPCTHLDCTQPLSFLFVIERLERARCATTRETGVNEVDGRAESGGEGREKNYLSSFLPIFRAGCASRSLHSLNYCGREKNGAPCSLVLTLLPTRFGNGLSVKL